MRTSESGPSDQRRDAERNYAQDLAEVARRLPGEDYRQGLGWIHEHGRPRNYLEIGVNFGKSFALARPDTRAVGVDPEPKLTCPVGGRIVEMTSDAFFARPDLLDVIEAPVQFAFIDGLHTFDQVLRDFLNVERLSSPSTVVALHDVYPIHSEVATRERQRIFWTGDVWKAAAILSRERPDLSLTFVPAPPSGLLLVTGLNPAGGPLRGNLDAIIGAWMGRRLPVDPDSLVAGFTRIANDEASVRDYVSRIWNAPASA